MRSIYIPDCVTSIGKLAFFRCSNLIIYAEADSKPENWDSDWNIDNRPIIWGCTLSEDNTFVVSFNKGATNIDNPNSSFLTVPPRAGYTFGGWTTTEGGVTADYTMANVNSAPDGTVLYALWTAKA